MACSGPEGGEPSPSGSAAAPGAAAPSATAAGADAAALDAILMAEQKRLPAEVRAEHLTSRSLAVRVAAGRALARAGGDPALPGLMKLLADDHPDVVTWAAYGLGFWCRGHEPGHVAALTARAVSLLAGAPPEKAKSPPPQVSVPLDAIARAVGSCAADTSEATLVAWLAGAPGIAQSAAFGLGDFVAAKQKLREETVVALLQRAAGSAAEPPLPAALFPLSRLDRPPPSTIDRLREVAVESLARPGPMRLFAVRALGRAGDDAAVPLGEVVAGPDKFVAAERGEAARALARLGKAGQRSLADVVPKLLPSADPVALTGLVSEDFSATLAALEAMSEAGQAEKALREVASRPPPPSPPAAVARRLSWLRCTAAKLVAGKNFREPLLAHCEVAAGESAPPQNKPPSSPDPGQTASAGQPPGSPAPSQTASAGQPGSPAPGQTASAGQPPGSPDPNQTSIAARAIVEVIGRAELKGARLTAWRNYAEGTDVRAREAAIGLLDDHEEADGTAAVLAKALASPLPGVVGAATEILTKHPDRAGEEPAKKRKKKGKGDKDKKDKDDKEQEAGHALAPSPAVVKALLALLQKKSDATDPESDDSVVDAVGALGLKEAEPRLNELCHSPYPTTREHAQKAITLLTGKKLECTAPAEGGPVPAEMHALLTGKTKLTLQTDAGEFVITLDAELAPVAVTRFVELAKSGYYDKKIVHRVVEGFVTQFGAPFGDGSGGPEGKAPLRCETSPLGFEALKVGVALAGRDTGSSQLFVMHGRAPHLDGRYALVGTASGPWGAFVDGDVIHKVTVQ